MADLSQQQNTVKIWHLGSELFVLCRYDTHGYIRQEPTAVTGVCKGWKSRQRCTTALSFEKISRFNKAPYWSITLYVGARVASSQDRWDVISICTHLYFMVWLCWEEVTADMTERERRSWGGGRLKSCLQSCKSYRLAKAALIACHMLGPRLDV